MNNVTGGTHGSEDAVISGLYNPASKVTDLQNLSIGKLLKLDGGVDIINLLFVAVGIYFFVSLIIAGWMFMTSSGDTKKAGLASGQITNAFTGLIMSFTAFLLVKIVTKILGIENIF